MIPGISGAIAGHPVGDPFELVTADTALTQASLTGPVSINLPSNIASGDILIVFATRRNGDLSAATGWTSLWNDQIEGLARYSACLYKVASGSEGSTVSVTSSDTASRATAAVAIRITGGHQTSAPEKSTAAGGNSTAPNPSSLSPSWGSEETLWLAVASHLATDASPGYPSGFTDDNENATTAGNCTCLMASLIETAASKDPGAFTITSSEWRAFTVGVRKA